MVFVVHAALHNDATQRSLMPKVYCSRLRLSGGRALLCLAFSAWFLGLHHRLVLVGITASGEPRDGLAACVYLRRCLQELSAGATCAQLRGRAFGARPAAPCSRRPCAA